MSTESIRRLAQDALATGRRPSGTTEFLDRDEANTLIVSAQTPASGRQTPVTAGEVRVIADLFERRHVVRNTPYPGPTTSQAPVPAGAVAIDAGAEERLWVFLQRHNAPVAELKPLVRERIEDILRRVRMPGTPTPAVSLAPAERIPFVLHDDGAGTVQTAFIDPNKNDFVIENKDPQGGALYYGPLGIPNILGRFEDTSRLPQFHAARAIRAATGVDVDLSASTFRKNNGELTVSFDLGPARFRVTPDRDQSGADILSRVVVVEQTPVISHSEAQSLEKALRESGVVRPDVVARGNVSTTRGATHLPVAAADATTSGGVLKLHTVVTEPSGRTSVAPFVYSDDQARALAVALVQREAYGLAENIGPSGTLEVAARTAGLTTSTIGAVARAEDSPTGFDPATEAQFVVERALGDMAVVVTFDRANGTVRVETP